MTMTIERVARINLSTGLVENVMLVDTDTDPPGTWPPEWITSTGKVNDAELDYTYVPVLNGFLPPKPNPTFLLDSTTMQWYPDPDEYYYWTDPVNMYYLYNRDDNTWSPYEFIGSAASTEIVIPSSPNFVFSQSATSISPGEYVDVTLTSSGDNQPYQTDYSVSTSGGAIEFEYVSQIYEVTTAVSSVDGVSPVFYVNGDELPGVLVYRGGTYEFNQDDASNTGFPLLLSETYDGTNALPTPGTIYNVNVEYYLDGSQVADSTAYLAGFDAAVQRKLIIAPLDESLSVDLYYFCNTAAPVGAVISSASLSRNGDAPLSGSFFYPTNGSTVRFGISAVSPPLTSTTVTVTVSGYSANPAVASFDVVPI